MDSVAKCIGQTYTLPGGNIVSTSGIFVDTLVSRYNCDSIITTNLTFSTFLTSNLFATICQGEPYILPLGSTVFSAGSYIDTLIAVGGCDSIIQTALTVNSTYLNNQNESICQGDSLLIYSVYQNSGGIYYDSLQTVQGCDSILSTTLTVNPVFSSNNNDTICQGDNIILGGTYQTASGVYVDSLQTITSCDSIVTTTLFVNSALTSNQNLSICEGDSLLLEGTYQTSNGIYVDSLQTVNGCDSILSTMLIVHPLPNVSLASFDLDTLCENLPLLIHPTGSPAGGIYTGTGVGNGYFYPSVAGIGTHDVIYTYTDVNSCISSDTTIVTVKICAVGINEVTSDFGIIIYPNPNSGLFTIEKPTDLNKELHIKLLDATARLIIQKTIPIGQQQVEMDITKYSKGLYYLQFIIEDKVFVKQILKD